MKISDLYIKKKPVLSFEVFPPRLDSPLETVFDTIHELKELNPDFISVTYGAGGSNRGRTVDISSKVKNSYGIEVLPHLTCVASTITDIDYVLQTLKDENVENILALRGDRPKDTPNYNFSDQEFKHSSDLIAHIKNQNHFCIAGACYPEGHLEAENIEADINNLKYKVDQGVDFLLSQIFYDNKLFYSYLDKVRNAGVALPISAGIMPVFNTKMIKNMTIMCGASLPKKLVALLNKYEGSPEDLSKAGIDYAAKQISDLIRHGVDGIHLCTMNKAEQIKQILKDIVTL